MQIESFIIDIIEGRRKNLFFEKVLLFFSWIFSFISKIKNTLYDKGHLKTHKVDATVISIGNLVAGGTGKTAVVELLAENLKEKQSLSILTRGYRSRIKGEGIKISNLESLLISPEYCGDEPYLLAKHLSVPVYVEKNRYQSAKKAVGDASKLLLLDDGFQHRSLSRDIEVVLLHGDDLFGKGHFLPRGYLRDHPKRLSKADFIIINHFQEEQLNSYVNQISKYSSAPIIGTQYQMLGVKGEKEIKNRRVALFCGIGSPQTFFKQMKTLGCEIVNTLSLPDHLPPTLNMWQEFQKNSAERGATLLICTEKDWIKFPISLECKLPIAYVAARLKVVYGHSHFNKLLSEALNH